MLRVVGSDSEAARIKNRIGEPAANPYLYMASQVASGLSGIAQALDPGPAADTPYECDAPLLPTSLAEAVDLLEVSAHFRSQFGDTFIDHFIRVKRAEIGRYNAEVSAWEQREYFELF